MRPQTTESALDRIRRERSRQDEKWGVRNHEPAWWLTIIMEELGEAARARLEECLGAYMRELIHMAATAAAAWECAQRHQPTSRPNSVYLAGPINDCSARQMTMWRFKAAEQINVTTRTPMRPIAKRDIVASDKEMIDACDILLANRWRQSVGTSMEILYAWERGKIVVVIEPAKRPLSPWVAAHCHWVAPNVYHAADTINRLASGDLSVDWRGKR